MKDWTGAELKTGDFVAYGYRSGNTGGICFAVVTNAEKKAIFSGGVQQGYGVDGDKLIKVRIEDHQAQYDSLMKTAEKWIKK